MTATSVFPDDEVVKINKHKGVNGVYDRAPIFKYQFNCTAGSAMRWALCTYTNLKTGEQYYSYFPKGGNINTYYNGDTVRVKEVVFNDIAKNGQDWQYQYTFFQTDPTTIADDTQYGDGVGLYDMYFCRGKIKEKNSTSKFIINKEIGNLKSAYYYTRSDDSVYLVGGAYIEIGEERRLIETYNYSTGEVELKNGFSTAPEADTVFRIFTNYFIDRPHYVKCREDPLVTLSVNTGTASKGFDLECSATYKHPNYIGLKYYKYRLYQTVGNADAVLDGTISEIESNTDINIGTGIEVDIVGKQIMIETTPSEETGHVVEGIRCVISGYNSSTGMATLKDNIFQLETGARYTIYNGDELLVDETDEIYSFDLDSSFYVDWAGNTFNIECEISTLDDKIYYYSIDKTFSSQNIINSDGTSKIVNFKSEMLDNHAVKITWEFNNLSTTSSLRIFRRNINEDKTVFVGTGYKSFIDYSVGNNQTYVYYLCYANYKAFASPTVKVQWDGWTIYSLVEQTSKHNRKYYKISDTWHFIANISDNDIVSNIGLAVHTGTGTKPKTTRTITDYESGAFSADLLTITCPHHSIIDNIDRVKAWNNFIKGQNEFLLKSHKGDVWVINISDNPTRIYDSTSVFGLTNIKYNWVEVENTGKVVIEG
jgi:hypothetical protein